MFRHFQRFNISSPDPESIFIWIGNDLESRIESGLFWQVVFGSDPKNLFRMRNTVNVDCQLNTYLTSLKLGFRAKL